MTAAPTVEYATTRATVPSADGDAMITVTVAWPVGSKEALAAVAVGLPAVVERFERDLAKRAGRYHQIDTEVAAFAARLAELPEAAQ